jgi:hypothetical protein
MHARERLQRLSIIVTRIRLRLVARYRRRAMLDVLASAILIDSALDRPRPPCLASYVPRWASLLSTSP